MLQFILQVLEQNSNYLFKYILLQSVFEICLRWLDIWVLLLHHYITVSKCDGLSIMKSFLSYLSRTATRVEGHSDWSPKTKREGEIVKEI